MKFDLSWFTTIPGILITCGVVLLIIALIIFIITSKKNKKEESKGEVAATQNVADQIATPIEIDNTPLPSMTSSNDAAVPIGLPDEPVPVAEPTPVVAPVEPATSIPVAEPTPVVAPVEEKPAIYGGVSEIIPNIDLNQKSDHQIYGGADPLENTQTLSVVSPSAPAVEPTPVVTIPTVEEATSQQSEPVINIIPSVEEVISGSNQ